jgi:uncharacterized cupin superfamily protein
MPGMNTRFDYRQGVAQDKVLPHHALEKDGWTVLSGAPRKSLRIDGGSPGSGPVVGIWSCTPGVIEMASLPFNEFVSLFGGKALVTVDNADPIEIKAGDSFFFPKGSAVRWDIRETVSKYMLVCGTGPVV